MLEIKKQRVSAYHWLSSGFILEVMLQEFHTIIAAARRPDTQPSAPHHTDNLKTKAPNTTGSSHLFNALELLMMGIVVPETC